MCERACVCWGEKGGGGDMCEGVGGLGVYVGRYVRKCARGRVGESQRSL